MKKKGLKLNLAAAAVSLALGGAAPLQRWTTVGPESAVRVSDSAIVLNAASPASVGALAPARSIGPAVLLVKAKVSGAAARAVTFSLHDVADGRTCAYWQNPLPIEQATSVAVALKPDKALREGRLFVGTHAQPSQASISEVSAKPVRRSVSVRTTIWGVLANQDHVGGQTYRATGTRLEAVQVRARQMGIVPDGEGPDLRVRVYPWPRQQSGDEKPLAEAVVSRNQLPRADGTGERELCVALEAPTVRGKDYLIEFSTTEPADQDHGFVLFGGPDEYPQGVRTDNGNEKGESDVWIDVFESTD